MNNIYNLLPFPMSIGGTEYFADDWRRAIKDLAELVEKPRRISKRPPYLMIENIMFGLDLGSDRFFCRGEHPVPRDFSDFHPPNPLLTNNERGAVIFGLWQLFWNPAPRLWVINFIERPYKLAFVVLPNNTLHLQTIGTVPPWPTAKQNPSV